MKFLSVLIVSLASSYAMAASVKVDSFYFIQNGLPLAELCGKVYDSAATNTIVRIVADPRTNKPGVYNTFSSGDGKFCLTLVTYSAEASAAVGSEVVYASAAKAVLQGQGR